MTVHVPGIAVLTRKPRWKQLLLPLEIPASRLACATSGSFRPKLGFCILLCVLAVCFCLAVFPLVFSASEEEHSPISDYVSSKIGSAGLPMGSVTNQQAVSAVSKANAEFTFKLYSLLIKSNGNMVMSPFSVETVLAMVLAGAAGKTAEEIRKAASFPGDDNLLPGFQEVLTLLNNLGSEKITLNAANRLFVQEGFSLLKPFLDINKKHYLADPAKTDYGQAEAARTTINSWVEAQTKNKIKDLIGKGVLNGLVRLVLVNAVYFKGDWASKFDPSKTSKGDFFVNGNKTVQADMMKMKGMLRMTSLKGASAVKLPYHGDRISMIVLLPNSKDGLSQLEQKLTGSDVTDGLTFGPPVKADLTLPKFKLESMHDLNDALIALGIKDMFEVSADLSGMANQPLHVSKMLQKAFIEVNEEGSEAAAATAGIAMLRAAVVTPSFVCDHPFIFMIKDDLTGMILFAGRVVDPSV